MYQNRIRRTANNLNPQFFIRRSEIAFDERVRYVEFVCGIWNEGRFGPDLADPVIIHLSDRPESEPVLFSDLLDNEPNGWNQLDRVFVMSPLGRAAYQAPRAAYRRAKQIGVENVGPTAGNSLAALTTNQGRGSP